MLGLITLEVEYYDPTIEHDPPQRPNVLIPEVFQEGYSFYFDSSCAGNLLQIVREGVIVFTTFIPTDVQQVSLPSTLSGNYEIQIIQGNLCFYGDITL